jgi:membrane protease YdiL (CAAX protease family)
LAIYFLVLVAGTAAIETTLALRGRGLGHETGLIALLMWTPAVASFVARLALREGIGDVSFRFGGPIGGKAILLAWVYPLIVAAVGYGIAWGTGLVSFVPPSLTSIHLALNNPAARFLALLLLNATLGTLIGALFAAGEEIGWRGYMLTRLIDAGIPRPVLISGLVWGLWHVPLILTGLYVAGPNRYESALVFVIDVIAIAYMAAYVRLKSGSVWPAVMVHASWNALIQGVFDASSKGSEVWIGESGLLITAANIVLVLLLVRGSWQVKRAPGDADRGVLRAAAV